MCRLLAYLGAPANLKRLLLEADHSLISQSYQPREMTAGTVNADGFGMAWYAPERRSEPFVYRNVFPIWNDLNLDDLASFIDSGCVLANVRSATPGQSLDFSNCHPFVAGRLACMHNGFVDEFRTTLYRPLRQGLSNEVYNSIMGTTDSEHIFALIREKIMGAEGQTATGASALGTALAAAIADIRALVPDTRAGLNFILSDGEHLVASRAAIGTGGPSLYWTTAYPGVEGVVIASEPTLSDTFWQACPDNALLTVTASGDVNVQPLD